MMMFAKFTDFVELRKGFQFSDPILRNFTAINLTWPIFILIYGGIAGALLSLVTSPHRLMILFEAYALMVLVRIVMMYILPLSPPHGIILLQDPLVQFFGTKKILSQDLFFSGHTSSLFLLYMGVPKKWKSLFLAMTITVAVCVLLQKAHYTVDVLVAPFIAFCCYQAIFKFFQHRYEGHEI